jgi:hypothetical protein
VCDGVRDRADLLVLQRRNAATYAHTVWRVACRHTAHVGLRRARLAQRRRSRDQHTRQYVTMLTC